MSTRKTKPQTFLFEDDGYVPNNPKLPFVVYRGAIDLAGTADPEELVEKMITDNGWGETWRNGIYEYVHYHSMIHEGLGIARGRAKVRFGGSKGEELDIAAGDFAILPAGTGHQCLWASPDLVVIPKVPMPDSDPVYGRNGPLLTLWRK